MRGLFAAGAVLAAAISGIEAKTSAQLCSDATTNDNNNYYCKQVKKITYTGIQQSGTYMETVDMSNGVCSKTSKSYSGALSPLNQELSIHLRGPMVLSQFAVYTLHSSSSKKAKRHGHGRFHERRQEIQEIQDRAEADAEKRAVGDMVTAVIDGQVKTWVNEYAGGAATPAAANTAAASVSSAAAATSKASSTITVGDGEWSRDAYYKSASEAATYGVAFLNTKGGQGSGVWDATFGNSLSFADSTGTGAAASNTRFGGVLKSSATEVIIMSDKACSNGDCGFYRPGTVAQHGFGGDAKAFVFDISMPLDGQVAESIYVPADMPSLWALNAKIPRVLQYGNDTTKTCCSCWDTGCGEFDIMEVLASGDKRAKSTLHRHGNIGGGDSNYFARPISGPIKLAVVMYQSQITVAVLDSFSFDEKLSAQTIKDIISTSPDSDDQSIFAIAG